MSLLQTIGGSIASLILLTLFYLSGRRLIQQSVAVWGMRVEEETGFDYQFTVQNLESVPIASKVCFLLKETDFRAASTPDQRNVSCLRVYSGATRPRFWKRSSNAADGSFDTRVELQRMDAFETWSFRLRTHARAVTMILGARELPTERTVSRFRSLGLNLSVERVELGNQKSVFSGPRKLPTWEAGLSIILIGPLAYGVGVWLLHLWGVLTLPETPSDVGIDCAVGALLALAGLTWFLWVRRAVVPAIRAYVKYWKPECDRPCEQGR
jgi:hypothetical protein